MRKGQSAVPPVDVGHDPARTAGILNSIVAVNLGAALFRERHDYRVVFLRNQTQSPFVTGDQPVINLLKPDATNNVELYYPLSPGLALVLSRDIAKYPDCTRDVTVFEVEHLNHEIYTRSDDQLYASDENYLRALIAVSKHALPS
jgi:hypothetical protein